MQITQPFDMCFINDGVAPRDARRHVALPVERVMYHNATQAERSIVVRIGLVPAAVKQRAINSFPCDTLRTGIEQ